MELVDTSVWARKKHPAVRDWFTTALAAGDIAICEMVALELLHSASTPDLYVTLEEALRANPWLPVSAEVTARALEVYGLLAAKGRQHHRSVKHADLFIAATAEVHRVTLVHYDHDYDAIAAVTDQPHRWVQLRGSI